MDGRAPLGQLGSVFADWIQAVNRLGQYAPRLCVRHCPGNASLPHHQTRLGARARRVRGVASSDVSGLRLLKKSRSVGLTTNPAGFEWKDGVSRRRWLCRGARLRRARGAGRSEAAEHPAHLLLQRPQQDLALLRLGEAADLRRHPGLGLERGLGLRHHGGDRGRHLVLRQLGLELGEAGGQRGVGHAAVGLGLDQRERGRGVAARHLGSQLSDPLGALGRGGVALVAGREEVAALEAGAPPLGEADLAAVRDLRAGEVEPGVVLVLLAVAVVVVVARRVGLAASAWLALAGHLADLLQELRLELGVLAAARLRAVRVGRGVEVAVAGLVPVGVERAGLVRRVRAAAAVSGAGRRCAHGHVRDGGDVGGGVGGGLAHDAGLGRDEGLLAVLDADDLEALVATADRDVGGLPRVHPGDLAVLLLVLDLEGEVGEALGAAVQQQVAEVVVGLDGLPLAFVREGGEARVPAADARPAAHEGLGVLEAGLDSHALAHAALLVRELLRSVWVVAKVDVDQVAVRADAVAVSEVVEDGGVVLADPDLHGVPDPAGGHADAAVELVRGDACHLAGVPVDGDGARDLLAVAADVVDVDVAQVRALALAVVVVAAKLHAAVHIARRGDRGDAGLRRGLAERPPDDAVALVGGAAFGDAVRGDAARQLQRAPCLFEERHEASFLQLGEVDAGCGLCHLRDGVGELSR